MNTRLRRTSFAALAAILVGICVISVPRRPTDHAAQRIRITTDRGIALASLFDGLTVVDQRLKPPSGPAKIIASIENMRLSHFLGLAPSIAHAAGGCNDGYNVDSSKSCPVGCGSLVPDVGSGPDPCQGTQLTAEYCNSPPNECAGLQGLGTCTIPGCCSNYGGYCSDSGECCGDTYVCTDHVCSQPGGGGSPIVLDPFNEGFHLTSQSNGVQFRVLPGDSKQQMSWTDANWRNGWLALDRDGNGTIDNFTELFGNDTPQPPSPSPNGFLALAVFDDPANGGNGNDVIDPGDSVYSRLRVWIDANHNGYSEPNELHTLASLGIAKIGLTYHDTPYVDQYGNRFRYKGSFWDQGGNQRTACYDVFLVIQPLN